MDSLSRGHLIRAKSPTSRTGSTAKHTHKHRARNTRGARKLSLKSPDQRHPLSNQRSLHNGRLKKTPGNGPAHDLKKFQIREAADFANMAKSLAKIYLTKRINMISTRRVYSAYKALFDFDESELLRKAAKTLTDASLEALLLLVRRTYTHHHGVARLLLEHSRYPVLLKMHKQVVVTQLNQKDASRVLFRDLLNGSSLGALLLLYKVRRRVSSVRFVAKLHTFLKRLLENDFELRLTRPARGESLVERLGSASFRFHKKLKQFLKTAVEAQSKHFSEQVLRSRSHLEMLLDDRLGDPRFLASESSTLPPKARLEATRPGSSLELNPLLGSFLAYYLLAKLNRRLRLKNQDYFRLSEQFFSLSVTLVKKLGQPVLERLTAHADTRGKSFLDYMYKGGRTELVNLHFIRNKIGQFWQPLASFDLLLDYNSHLHRLRKAPTFRLGEYFVPLLDDKRTTRSEWQFSVFESSLKSRIFVQIFNTTAFIANELAFTAVHDGVWGSAPQASSQSVLRALLDQSHRVTVAWLVLRLMFLAHNLFHLFLVSAAKQTKLWMRSKLLVCVFLVAHSYCLWRPVGWASRHRLAWVNVSALGVYLGVFQLYHLMANLLTVGKLLQIIVSLVKVGSPDPVCLRAGDAVHHGLHRLRVQPGVLDVEVPEQPVRRPLHDGAGAVRVFVRRGGLLARAGALLGLGERGAGVPVVFRQRHAGQHSHGLLDGFVPKNRRSRVVQDFTAQIRLFQVHPDQPSPGRVSAAFFSGVRVRVRGSVLCALPVGAGGARADQGPERVHALCVLGTSFQRFRLAQNLVGVCVVLPEDFPENQGHLFGETASVDAAALAAVWSIFDDLANRVRRSKFGVRDHGLFFCPSQCKPATASSEYNEASSARIRSGRQFGQAASPPQIKK